MRGDEDFRPDPADHIEQFGAPRMPGDVNEVGAVGDDLDALPDQAVDHTIHVLLVAGDGARREDHAVAPGEGDLRMLVLGDARERGTRLTLAART